MPEPLNKSPGQLLDLIKNPFLKAASYILLAMIISIGGVWVVLGILSPVLLVLLIQKW